MKKNFEYLTRLRQVMAEQKVDVVIISGTDPHQSENPPHHWRDREWITGFWSTNGTNGTAVVLQDQAYCWTDSRYFIQAEEQLADTGFKMMKEDGPEAIDLIGWITQNVAEGFRQRIPLLFPSKLNHPAKPAFCRRPDAPPSDTLYPGGHGSYFVFDELQRVLS